MNITDVALMIKGIIEGNNRVEICGFNGIDTVHLNELTFAVDDEHLGMAEKSMAACVLTNKIVRKSTKPLIRVENPKLAFVMLYNKFNLREVKPEFIHPKAVVSSSARLGKNVWIGSGAVIEDDVIIGDNTVIESNSVVKCKVQIGLNCHLYPNVTIYENVKLGKNVILHAGAVVGSDGFGYVKDGGEVYKFPQQGSVIVENDVEIGANTTVDRGALSDTIIGAKTKIDNLCQIAHNVKIGRNGFIAAQCGISGSTIVGDNVMMGGQSGIVDNIVVGDNVTIAAKSAVIGDIKSNSVVWGTPARQIAQTKKQMAVLSWVTKNFKSLSYIMGKKTDQ
ncbi:MAG TPA: UDP-3-O-(3-hydroxymyristoyl)glucosamine N-acyltransferase [Candidatus Omnitrophota bacterium]|nr:UDP-3-O-(3-hydroxymyristoyl)glucosamine N-acyltransferase [Candidatus Omnitrophota bacterium]HPS19801.1 UDP-3-O-(3-hydroxymyristoyl)glucosamine N-acyltransferase [Candidatus Omnitrophota bacterium]